MPFIRKEHPGEAPGGHVWNEPGEVVEVVDHDLAHSLLLHPGFTEVDGPATAPKNSRTRGERTPVTETDAEA